MRHSRIAPFLYSPNSIYFKSLILHNTSYCNIASTFSVFIIWLRVGKITINEAIQSTPFDLNFSLTEEVVNNSRKQKSPATKFRWRMMVFENKLATKYIHNHITEWRNQLFCQYQWNNCKWYKSMEWVNSQ